MKWLFIEEDLQISESRTMVKELTYWMFFIRIRVGEI